MARSSKADDKDNKAAPVAEDLPEEVLKLAPEVTVIEAQPGKPDEVLELHPHVEAPQKDNPRIFAHVVNKRVREIITERDNIEDEWPADLRKEFVEITDVAEPPKVGFTHKGGKNFQEPDRTLSPELQRGKAFKDGAEIKGSKFSVTPDQWQQMTDAAQHVNLFGEFPGGAKKFTWQADPPVDFTDTTDFMNVVKSLSTWRHKWNDHVSGGGKGKPPDAKLD